jgi:hypothetical protein
LFGARVNPKTQARVGRSVDLAIDVGGFNFFDTQSGRAIGRVTEGEGARDRRDPSPTIHLVPAAHHWEDKACGTWSPRDRLQHHRCQSGGLGPRWQGGRRRPGPLQEIRPRRGYSEQRAEGWWEATATAVAGPLGSVETDHIAYRPHGPWAEDLITAIGLHPAQFCDTWAPP